MPDYCYASLEGFESSDVDDSRIPRIPSVLSAASKDGYDSFCCVRREDSLEEPFGEESESETSDSDDSSDEESKETAQRVVPQDFHSYEAPGVQPARLLVCLMLRLFYPFSWWAVDILLRLKFIEPIMENMWEPYEKYTTTSQVRMTFMLYGAWVGLSVSPLLACNVVAYGVFEWYRSTGPPFAVIFPWLASLLIIPRAVAGAGSFFDNKLCITYSLFLQFLTLVARQCRLPNSVCRKIQRLNGTANSCLIAIELMTKQQGHLTIQKQVDCLSRRTSDKPKAWLRQVVVSHNTQLIRILGRPRFSFLLGSTKVADTTWMDRWPATDRFLTQQRRINNLHHITLFVPASDAHGIPAELLESYKKGLKNRNMSATDFASQMSVGFAPSSLTGGLHTTVGCLHNVVVVASCFVAWWLPQWHHGTWYSIVMLGVFLVFGLLQGVSLLTSHLLNCSYEFAKRLMELKALNASLAGPVAAASRFVPMMRVNVSSDLLVWAEVRELCLASYAARQLEVELSVLVTTVLTLAMAVACLYSALQSSWEPGLFSLVALLTMILYIINAVPFFITAALVNLENRNTTNLMWQYALQAQVALSHPSVATANEKEQMQQTLSMAKLLSQVLKGDSPANVHILGAKITLSSASALASAVTTALAFTLKNLPLEQIKSRLYESDAWQVWFK